MNDEQTKTVSPRRLKRVAGGVALLAGGAIAGGVLASTLTASAADNSAGTPPPADGAVHGFEHPGGPARVRGDETQLTGSGATAARTAALKAVPGGTIYRIETDAGDATYEVHMTRADGALVTVKLDKGFSVLGVEDGMGQGDPAPAAPATGG